ncbi:unnamed protein product [Calypogeia fissa]
MKECGVILPTLDLNPSRGLLMSWINQSIAPRLDITFIQIKVLARSLYLLMLNSSNDRLRLLAATPLYMEGRLVVVLPWEPNLDATTLATRFVPMWVDVVDVHPVLEMYATQMLMKVGRVIYSTIQTAVCRYMNMRGCVLCDIRKEKAHFVDFDVPGVGGQLVEVSYKSGPEHCPLCTNTGHLPFNYPLKPKPSPVKANSPQPAHKNPIIDEDGFQLVTRKNKGKAKVGFHESNHVGAMDTSPIHCSPSRPTHHPTMEAGCSKTYKATTSSKSSSAGDTTPFQDAHDSSLAGPCEESPTGCESPKPPELVKKVFLDETTYVSTTSNDDFVARSGNGYANPGPSSRFSARSLYNSTSTESASAALHTSGPSQEDVLSLGKKFSALEVMNIGSSHEEHVKMGRKATTSSTQDTPSSPTAIITRQASQVAKQIKGRAIPPSIESNALKSGGLALTGSLHTRVGSQSTILTPIFCPPIFSSPSGSTHSPSMAINPNPYSEWAA